MKSDRYRLERMSSIGHQLLDVLDRRGITKAELLEDIEVQWMVATPLYNIGEQANCISREFADLHPEIPWAQVAGLRHRLVHDYEGITWTLISSVLFDELPGVLSQIDLLLVQLND